ncbi:MAG: hypothetical protein GY795_21810 [Desulfobacterales bacterium]|nr:hypothetical protein [Desulfobacterales bacterium]
MEQSANSTEQDHRIKEFWINELKCVTCHAGIPEADTGDKYLSKSFSVFEDLRGFGNPAGLLSGYT